MQQHSNWTRLQYKVPATDDSFFKMDHERIAHAVGSGTAYPQHIIHQGSRIVSSSKQNAYTPTVDIVNTITAPRTNSTHLFKFSFIRTKQVSCGHLSQHHQQTLTMPNSLLWGWAGAATSSPPAPRTPVALVVAASRRHAKASDCSRGITSSDRGR